MSSAFTRYKGVAMKDENSWIQALEIEIKNVELVEERLSETNFDEETKSIIRQRLLANVQEGLIQNA